MPEWEAFHFRKFFKNGYYKDNLSHAKVLALYLQSEGHLNVKKGAFSPPVHLVFHFFQPKLAHIFRFVKGIS